ncbi:hypothetical protein [Bradyrhizobium sp. SZCCHNRI1073]|uniref:hypothetical protein n=1 Tax=Bradyrhizobium sp. SZCCHNRI1073 TaxID=3057280 RepID=UPI00291631EC|nr:hypothetical protein [Bradyrhizobium sp. SZCCHNRI1073]
MLSATRCSNGQRDRAKLTVTWLRQTDENLRPNGFAAAIVQLRDAVSEREKLHGAVVFEASVTTDPAIIFEALTPYLPRLDKVGHEAGSVAQWLYRELGCLGLPMVLVETWQAGCAGGPARQDRQE